jgi:fumarate reductase subunit D
MVRLRAWPLLALACGETWLPLRPALAQTEPAAEAPAPRHFGGQRAFGFGPSFIGWGAGGMAHIVLAPVGLLLSGGYVPLFILGNKHDAARTITFAVYSSAQLNAEVTIMPWQRGQRLDFGLVAGYKFNTVLGHGVGGGLALTYDLSKAFGLFGSVDYSVFPQTQDQLASRGYPTDRDASIPWLQGSGNLGVLLYP